MHLQTEVPLVETAPPPRSKRVHELWWDLALNHGDLKRFKRWHSRYGLTAQDRTLYDACCSIRKPSPERFERYLRGVLSAPALKNGLQVVPKSTQQLDALKDANPNFYRDYRMYFPRGYRPK